MKTALWLLKVARRWYIVLAPIIIGVLSSMDENWIKEDSLGRAFYLGIFERRFGFILWGSVALLICTIIEAAFQKWYINKEMLKDLSQLCQEACFESVPVKTRYEYRVTIFRTTWGCWFSWSLRRWPWQTCLKCIARAGPMEEKNPWFWVFPDEAKCEGVAGAAWYRKEPVDPINLPKWGDDPHSQKQYAAAGMMSVETAKRLNVKSRCIAAVPIMIDGEAWGVLVLDSRKSGGVKEDAVIIADRYASIIALNLRSEY
jgi:hypothetical protein